MAALPVCRGWPRTALSAMNRPPQCSYNRRRPKSLPICEKSKCSAPQNLTRAIRMLYLRQVEYSEQRHQGYTDTRCPDAGISLPSVDMMMLARPNAVTEERLNTRDSTRNSTYGVLRPTSSSDVYRVGRYYVGVLKELPPPDAIYDEWNERICGDLINHLLAVTDSLPNDIPDDHLIIEPVLCMAGKTKSMRLTTHERHARGKVMLEPMVWIHCGSRKCRRKVKETIHQARFLRNFLQRFGMADAYIALEAPWPAAHIASTSDQQYSSTSDEQKVSVDGQDRRPYRSGYDLPSPYRHPSLPPPPTYSSPSYPSPIYPEGSARPVWQSSSTANTSRSQHGNRMPFGDPQYYPTLSSTYGDPGIYTAPGYLSHMPPYPRAPHGHPYIDGPASASSDLRGGGINPNHVHYPYSPETPSLYSQSSQWPHTVSYGTPSLFGARARRSPDSRRDSSIEHSAISHTTREYAENVSSDSYMRPRQTMRDVEGRQLTLSFAVQRRYDIPSACGIKTRFSVHESGSSFSTIGGLVLVDNAVFGLTTAHGIIGCVAASKTAPSSDTDEDTSESGSDTEIQLPAKSSVPKNRHHVHSKDSRIATQGTAQHEWSPVSVPSVVSYKGRGTLTGDYSLPTQSPPMSDFALIDPDAKFMSILKNIYRDPSTSSIQEIAGSLSNDQLSAGDVLIITSSNVTPGYLLDGTASVILRGTAMRTKKIQTTLPRGWELAQLFLPRLSNCHIGEGISGAWVVRNRMVCGCVFAAYNTGRYLHMLPIEDILRNISQFMNATSVRIATSDDLSAPTPSASKHPAGVPGDVSDGIQHWSMRQPLPRVLGDSRQTIRSTPPRAISPPSSSILDQRIRHNDSINSVYDGPTDCL